ncbi:MAG: DPP IV N-terminal domain-containing protein [Pirellulales bacterium]
MSTDGRFVLLSLPRTGSGDLYRYDIATQRTHRLTDNPNYEGDATYSPSGDRIAYVREVDGVGNIWLMNADGSDQRQLTSSSHYDHSPMFINARTIVFSRNTHAQLGTSAELSSVDVATGQVRTIGNGKMRGAFAVPVGDYDLLYSRFNGCNDEVVLLSLDGFRERVLFQGSCPAVSADGRQCVFIQDRGNYHYDIRLYSFETKELAWITDSKVYKSYPSFLDSERVAFVSEPSADGLGTLKVINVKTGVINDLYDIK